MNRESKHTVTYDESVPEAAIDLEKEAQEIPLAELARMAFQALVYQDQEGLAGIKGATDDAKQAWECLKLELEDVSRVIRIMKRLEPGNLREAENELVDRMDTVNKFANLLLSSSYIQAELAPLMSKVTFLLKQKYGEGDLVKQLALYLAKPELPDLTKIAAIFQFPHLFSQESINFETFIEYVLGKSRTISADKVIDNIFSFVLPRLTVRTRDQETIARTLKAYLYGCAHILAAKPILYSNKNSHQSKNLHILSEIYSKLVAKLEEGEKAATIKEYNIGKDLPTEDEMRGVKMPTDLANYSTLLLMFGQVTGRRARLEGFEQPVTFLLSNKNSIEASGVLSQVVLRDLLLYLEGIEDGVATPISRKTFLRIREVLACCLKNIENSGHNFNTLLNENLRIRVPDLYATYLDRLLGKSEIVSDLNGGAIKDQYRALITPIFFSPSTFATHRQIFDKLIDLTLKGDSGHFYNCCRTLAEVIGQDNRAINEYIVEKMFPNAQALTDSIRSQAVRNVLELLPQEKWTAFSRILAINPLPLSPEMDEQVAGMAGEFRQYLGISEKQVEALTATEKSTSTELGMPVIESPRRDNDGLLNEILAQRSIHLSRNGSRLASTNIDSYLEEYFVECLIEPNKETKRNPDSLACSIRLQRADESRMYARISSENILYIRYFKDGKLEKEECWPELARDDERLNIAYQELWYFILRKLEHLLVRKAPSSRTPDFTLQESEKPEIDQTPDEIPELEPPEAKPAQVPLAAERVTTTHVLDITEGEEMRASDLPSTSPTGDLLQKQMSARVKANRKLALQLLKMHNSAEGLSEKIPEELTHLIIYRKEIIDGDAFYEAVNTENFYLKLRRQGASIDLSQYHVRTKRAHSVAMPYLKYEDDRSPLIRVQQKRPDRETTEFKQTLLTDAGENGGIDLEIRPRILHFDADFTEENEALFEALSDSQRIEADIRKRTWKALDKNIQKAEAKYPIENHVPNERLLQIKNRMWRLAEFRQTQEIAKANELLSRFSQYEKPVDGDAIRGDTRTKLVLRMPQIFPFEQTFNQGSFESLEAVNNRLLAERKVSVL